MISKQCVPQNATWGALHKIGRFRNVPTVGTFINKLKLNLLTNVPTVGTFRKRPILCNAPLVSDLGAVVPHKDESVNVR